LDFAADDTYPYTYTIVQSFDQEDGSDKEARFSIKVFTQDGNAKLTKLN